MSHLMRSWPERKKEAFGVGRCYERKSLAILKGLEPQSILSHSQQLRMIPRGG